MRQHTDMVESCGQVGAEFFLKSSLGHLRISAGTISISPSSGAFGNLLYHLGDFHAPRTLSFSFNQLERSLTLMAHHDNRLRAHRILGKVRNHVTDIETWIIKANAVLQMQSDTEPAPEAA